MPRESLPPVLDLEDFGGRLAECFGALVVTRAVFFGVDLLAETHPAENLTPLGIRSDTE